MLLSAKSSLLDSIREQACELRASILSATHEPKPGAVVYYIAPDGDDSLDGLTPETAWATLDVLAEREIAPGSEVLFERGGLWRGRFVAKPGVTYSAFGDGDKPKIYGSPFNGAEYGEWTEVAPNIWRYSEKFEGDVGCLIFDGGKANARKVIVDYSKDVPMDQERRVPFGGYEKLESDLDMWHDLGGAVNNNPEGGYIYLRSDEGDPAKRFSEIEFNTRGNIIRIGGDDVTIDNLCIKYGGCHGIGSGTVNGLTVTNCEVGWIGGCIQFYRDGRVTRFGNGVEIYGGCDRFTIAHNYVYECYDAGITHQYSAGGDNDIIQTNVLYEKNLIENCVYNIEYFLGKAASPTATRYMSNIVMRDNILRFAGYGWGAQRPDKGPDAHIKGWDHQNILRGEMLIENNIMQCSKHMMIHTGVEQKAHLATLRGNTFIQHEGGYFGRFMQNPTTNEPYTAEVLEREEFAGNQFYVLSRD